MKALVIGADGGIGRALVNELGTRGYLVTGTTRRAGNVSAYNHYLDLSDQHIAEKPLPSADVAFFCAAMAGFADCRRDPALAYRVNVLGPLTIARRLAAAGTRLLLLSTNAVFDGSTPLVSASNPPCPVSVYGNVKAKAEAEFLALGPAVAILRLSKVLTTDFKLLTGWIDALSHGKRITAFKDLSIAPISLADAVQALLATSNDGGGGIYQFSSSKDLSYAEVARHFARRLEVPLSRVNERHAAEAGIPAEEIRKFSSLDSSRLAQIIGRETPDPFAALDEVYKAKIESSVAHNRATD